MNHILTNWIYIPNRYVCITCRFLNKFKLTRYLMEQETVNRECLLILVRKLNQIAITLPRKPAEEIISILSSIENICYFPNDLRKSEDYDKEIAKKRAEKWILCTTKMPNMQNDISENVLVITSDFRIFEANYFKYFNGNPGWRDFQNTWLIEDVTHWQPLPEFPMK